MKIHGMCIVKNEADIIDQSLKLATKWCDFIYVFDNGSTDGTWEIVSHLSKKYEQIILYKQKKCDFYNGLRGEIFNHYRANSSKDDWWCTLDADEFYIDNPQDFLINIPKQYQVVCSASLQYYFTDKDLKLYQCNPSLYADHIPIEHKIRYYLNNWSEKRFFRYRKNLKWNTKEASWPTNLGAIYPQRIRLKHYQYRSPQQIQKRLDVRFETEARGKKIFHHEFQSNWIDTVVNTSKISSINSNQVNMRHTWEERIIPAYLLNYDNHDGNYVTREDLMPKLHQKQIYLKKFLSKLSKKNFFFKGV